ncbi:MAG: methyltransferase [Acidimicrobiaceae bacterium]|nr:methyltransferase [Acidimicrobiaceae bacterium]
MEGAHYFDQEPTVASKPAQTEVNLPDLTVTLTSDRGVFSHDRLDPGTKLLLTDAPPVDDDAVTLDIGCGWGPIACVTALRTRGGRIWAIDTNSRARTLTEINAREIGAADRITVAPPTEIPKGVRFDRILSNPPIRIGKPALHQLLESWLSRLNPGGQAHLVVQKHLGSDSLSRWLTGQGFPTIRWVSRSGYRILEVDPREDS